MKIYVGNLSYNTTEEQLSDLFSQKGTLSSVNLIKDKQTGQSKGFGFVEFADAAAGEDAISEFNGYEFNGRALKVSEAQEKPRDSRPPRRDGGNRGFQRRDRY